ncbi:MAG: hypothetical protein HZB81_00030 [Deltaproteobacteria bacterium]|nr:hypothetical protein [Deltaproteobacteria bacterium]
MTDTHSIIVYALIFIGMLAVIFVGGRYARKIPSDTTKRINQISFGIAIGSGILLYLLHNAIMYLFLAALVVFFLFFNYKEEG